MRWAMVLGIVFCLLTASTAQVDPFSTRPKIRQPLSLREAVEIALWESPILRGAVAELKAAEARLQMARSEKRWQLSVNAFASTGTEGAILASPPTVMPTQCSCSQFSRAGDWKPSSAKRKPFAMRRQRSWKRCDWM
jgi:hypothetical protein